MKIHLLPLYSQLNAGVGSCPLGCQKVCRVVEQAPNLIPPPGQTCPLSSHQVQTYIQVTQGDADIIFNKSATGDGKSLGASLPSLLDPSFRFMGLYPTIELVEDQTQQQYHYHSLFNLNAEERIDRLFGEELSRRVKEADSNRFQELLLAIQQKQILLSNPDIFHLITHFQYRDPAYGNDLLPLALAEWPDLWVFDEFPIFGSHQETAALNSLTFIRSTQQQPRRFLFTSATPKQDFIEQLKQANFKVAEIAGVYANEDTTGYRPILQPVELEFVELKDTDTLSWLTNMAPRIQEILEAESNGRGLIIVNSVALAGRVTQQLHNLLPGVIVREISGRIDRLSRQKIQAALKEATQPVLIIATSAADTGVDYRIHLLMFESSDSATIIQRLGRLGRHPNFTSYKAFILLPGHAPWLMARLQENLESGQTVERSVLQEAIAYAFDPPRELQEYRNCWGALQAQGMFSCMTKENAKVMQSIRDRMTEDLQHVYPQNFESARKHWFKLGNDNDDVGKEIQKELLRFRGGSTLQAAVWDENRFYTYDLFRLLPYATVEVIDRETFVNAATKAGHSEEAFPDKYIKVYLRIQEWTNERFNISLHCNRDSRELQPCQLSLISRLSIVGHPQADVVTCLSRKKLLTFLVPVNRNKPSSHWDVSRHLNLSPSFGLYRVTDGSEQAYGCAFNQDALFLEALKWRLQRFCRTQSQSLIF
ncbi:MAG: type I-D CRISPR-associated helicase Cas3' [Potamolinea sp.]